MKLLVSSPNRLVLLAALLLQDAQAFSASPVRPTTRTRPRLSDSNIARHATIFYGNDDEFVMEDESVRESNTPAQLVESLSKSLMAPLARLACAFAPPGHSLKPSDLESAHVVSVNDHQIEISAVLCEGGGCVQVMVPVTFPRPCSDSPALEDCILQNIEELDHQAYSMIAQENYKENNFEQIQADKRLFTVLTEEPMADNMPLWWSFPMLMDGMDKECRNVKELLNEADFADEIGALATVKIEERCWEHPVVGVTSAVAAVGTAGILLRTQVRQLDHTRESGERISIVDLPVRFDEEAKTADDLRASVLGLVAAAVA
jgi:hypothetical protein